MQIKKYLHVNITALVIAIVNALLLYHFAHQSLGNTIGWVIGVYALVWCAYIDSRIQMAPDRYLVILCIAPMIAGAIDIQTTGIIEFTERLISICIAAGGIWLFRVIFSAILQKEALGEADIFPCAFVGGMIGVVPGIMTFLLTPLVVLPIIAGIAITQKKFIKKLPLLPAMLITTLISTPLYICLQNYLQQS